VLLFLLSVVVTATAAIVALDPIRRPRQSRLKSWRLWFSIAKVGATLEGGTA